MLAANSGPASPESRPHFRFGPKADVTDWLTDVRSEG